MRHHTGKDVAENIFSNLSDYVSSEQYVGGSYDGAYFHQSVPKYLAEMFEVDEKTFRMIMIGYISVEKVKKMLGQKPKITG